MVLFIYVHALLCSKSPGASLSPSFVLALSYLKIIIVVPFRIYNVKSFFDFAKNKLSITPTSVIDIVVIGHP